MASVAFPDTEPVLLVPTAVAGSNRLLELGNDPTKAVFPAHGEGLNVGWPASVGTGSNASEVRLRIRKPDGSTGTPLRFFTTASRNGSAICQRGTDQAGFLTFASMTDTRTRSGTFEFTHSRIAGKSVVAALPSIEFCNNLHAPNVLQAAWEPEPFRDYHALPSRNNWLPGPVMDYIHSLATIQTRSAEPILIPDLTTVTDGDVVAVNDAAALLLGETLRSRWAQLNWKYSSSSERIKRRKGQVDLGSHYQLVIVGPLTVKVGKKELTLGGVRKLLLSARLIARDEELQAVPFLNDAMDRTFDPHLSAPDRSHQRVMGKIIGPLNEWLTQNSGAPEYRRHLRAAGAGQSGHTDTSERIEELLADEAKR